MGRMKNKVRTWTPEERIEHGKKMFELRSQDRVVYTAIASQYGCTTNTVTDTIKLYLMSTGKTEKEAKEIMKNMSKRGYTYGM